MKKQPRTQKQSNLELKLVRIRDLTATEVERAVGGGCSLHSAQICDVKK